MSDMKLNQLIHGDCMEVMKDIPDKFFELAIVDPPYGIFDKKNQNCDWSKEGNGGTWASKYNDQAKRWDIKPSKKYFIELKRISEKQIIWGANHFGYAFNNYVCWKKLTISESFSMGMCEIASVSLRGNPKIFEHAPQNPERFHPTQKPVALYRWLLKNYAKQGDKILDTHAGSCSSVIACIDYGFEYLAIEKDKEYFDKATERINKHKFQFKLAL